MVVALFAALLVPWFVNWDRYRVNFEREATRILGHPVHVGGAAHVSILPSPSVTFADVEVGDPGAEPIVTIENFAATIELMPLLGGEIRVVAMKLDRPHVRIAANEAGAIDWLQHPTSSQKLDPDKVVLGDVQISDGTLTFSDARTGVALAFGGITASVEAASLAGPWRAEGSYRDGERAVPFHFATGRQLEDGTIRLQSDFSPPQWPVSVSADGVLASTAETGATYTGTYSVTEVIDGAAPANGETDKSASVGWRSQGTFALARDRIVVDKAVLSNGPAEQATSVAGSLAINFGKEPSFAASAEARQLDLDRSFGGGPSEPIDVAAAASGLVDWLVALPVPTIPGHIAFNVPGIVVGGSVIQDVAFVATPAPDGWQVSGFHARLPGQASIEADGTLTTRDAVGFAGRARLAVAQPATFASWWRGGAQAGSGRLLSAFDISGDATLAPGRVSVDKIDARIGDATITGRFDWGEVKGKRRALSTDLKADRIDFAQVKALADLLVGRDLTDAGALADSFSIRLAADAFQYGDIGVKGVAVDAAYADDVLNVVQFAIGDFGGASVRVTSGRIDSLTTNPRGHLEARLEATTVEGLAVIAGKLAPDSGIAAWLGRTAPVLAPSVVNARITAPPKGASGFQVALDGVAGQTSFNATVQSAVSLKDVAAWRGSSATFSLVADSPDSAGLAQQFGFAAVTTKDDGGAHLSVKGAGVPQDGLDTTIDTEFAGVGTKAEGKLTLAAGAAPAFAGTVALSADDLAAFIATAGLSIPGAAAGTPVAISGTIATTGTEARLAWKNGTVADRAVSGDVTIGRAADRSWRIDGNLGVDAVDLGWLAALSLGFPPEMTGNPKTPWPKTPFSPPTYGPVSGKLTVSTEHLGVGDLDVTGGTLALALQPNRIDVDLKGGHIAGGAAAGGVSIQNVDGNASLTGQFNLTGAALDPFMWQRQGRVVATGGLDLSANFESTGHSPAALVSSMTGSGVISLHNGVARYVNPETARAVVRISDLGEPFSDEALQAAVEEQIDADSLPFAETGAAFTVAAGTVRINGLMARGSNVEADGSAVIDLNALTLDSDWTLTFATGETIPEVGAAKIGVVFRGPLASPARIIDALPLNSYLSTRQAARMLDIIATEEADRAERQRLQEQIVKIRTDAARAERERADAIANERRRTEVAANAAAKVALLHVDREIDSDARAVAMLTQAVERTAAAQAEAAKLAAIAAQHAADTRAKSEEAAAALAAAITADTNAGAAVAAAKAQLAAAQAMAAKAADRATQAGAQADAAEATASTAIAAETAAKQTAATATAAAASATATLDAANAKATETGTAGVSAASDATAKKAALDAAGKALADAITARDAASDTLALASTALDEVKTVADKSAVTAAAASQAATEADAERARLEMLARIAVDAQHQAEALRDTARAEADTDKSAYALALGELASAESSDPGGSGMPVTARRAAADHARQKSEIASRAYDDAEAKAAAAGSAATAAQAAADDAAARAAGLAAAAAREAASNAAAQARLPEKTAARDAAAAAASAAADVAQKAGATFDTALTAAGAAAARAGDARNAAEAAVAEQSTATRASAASGAGVAGFALQQATAARAKAVADATAARAAADAAKAEAATAADNVAALIAAQDAAIAAAAVAHSARVASEQAATAATADATKADADAMAAAAEARARADEAAAAAARIQSAAGGAEKPVAMPLPRQRQKPFSLVPDAVAGDAPMTITPAE